MEDLISRKALVHGLIEDYEKCMSFDGLLNYIHNQPIAYDVDKVAEQIREYLNGYRICSDYDEEFFMALEEFIINIVEGVSDESNI